MRIIYIIYALLAGIFTTLEGTINSKLGKIVTPSIATLHSLATGMAFILLISLVKGSIVRYSKVVYVSPIWLVGGIFGALIIYLYAKSIPTLGITTALILVLTGQLVSGIILDSLVNNIELPISKIVGLVLFLVGAFLFIKE